jgi:hypothetical protein
MKEESTKTSAAAIASLVLGILSLLCLGILTGLPAIICGHISLSKQKKDAFLTGKGMAIAGLVTGYLGIAWSIGVTFLALPSLLDSALPYIYTLF